VPAYECFFFGREQDSRALADHVVSRPITVLYGPSGVGKSSVVNVGLPAALRLRGAWTVPTLRKWQDPNTIEHRAVEALRDALPRPIGEKLRHTRFARAAVSALRATKQPMLLILDQFEEYFIYKTGNSFNAAELGLGQLLARRDLDMHVLIALRDDSLHLLDKLRAIFPGILETTVRLGHLNDAAAEQAIRSPILQYNEIYRKGVAPVEVEDALVEKLVVDLRQGGGRMIVDSAGLLGSEPIELPYLQLTMTKLWAAEGGRDAKSLRFNTLTDRLGGVQQIAREHVERILGGLTEKEQALCADIFRNLITSSGSKVAYPSSDLAVQINEDRREASGGRFQEIVTNEEVAEVLRKLTPTETRLLKPVKASGVDAFELFHDVLGKPMMLWRQQFTEQARLRKELQRADERKALERLLKVIRPTADLSDRQLLKEAPALAAKLATEQAAGAAPFVLGTIEQTTDPERLLLLVQALHALPLELAEVQTQQAINSILFVIKTTTDHFAYKNLADALKVLPAKLTDAQVQAAINPIVTAIRQASDPLIDARPSLVNALETVTAELRGPPAQAAIASILAAMKQTTDADALGPLKQALLSQAAKLTDAQARVTIESILVVLKQNSNPVEVPQLALALTAFNSGLTDANIHAAVGIVLDAFARTSDPNQLRPLALALKSLPDKLNNAQARAAIESVLKLMQNTEASTDAKKNIVLQSRAETLRALATKLTESQARVAIELLVATIEQTRDPIALQSFAQVLPLLAVKLIDAQASTKSILMLINQIKDPYPLRSLAEALCAFTPKVTKGQAQAAIETIVTAIKQTGDPIGLQSLVRALHLLPVTPTEAHVQAVTEHLLAVVKKTTDPYDLQSLAQVLRTLPIKLTNSQAQSTIDAIERYLARPPRW
jgi:hypothetical protein